VGPIDAPSTQQPTESVDGALVAALLACEGELMVCPDAQWIVLLKEEPKGQLTSLAVVGATAFRRTDGRVVNHADWKREADFMRSPSSILVLELQLESKGETVVGYLGSGAYDRSGRSSLMCGGQPITVKKAGDQWVCAESAP
jgi:hypothetical protein